MKIKTRIFSLAAAGLLALSGLGLTTSAYDYDPPEPFCDYGFKIVDGKEVSSEYMDVWKEKIFEEDFTVESSHDLRIEKVGSDPDTAGGKIVVTDGATLELRGKLFIERGAVLEIENGTVNVHGGTLQNCGTIIIGEKGRLHFQNGWLNSTAAGSIVNNGKITCMSSEKNLAGIFKIIKNSDENFDLSDYSVLMTGRGGNNADIVLNYCIDDVQTDYTYKFSVNVNNTKTTIKRKAYPLETVYSADTGKNILDRAAEFEKNYVRDPGFANGYYQDYGYTYSYRTGKMLYEETWFTYDGADEIFYDHTYSAEVI